MKDSLKHIFILFLLTITYGYGQISPGDLTESHADLEGMSKCTLCHDIGEKSVQQEMLGLS